MHTQSLLAPFCMGKHVSKDQNRAYFGSFLLGINRLAWSPPPPKEVWYYEQPLPEGKKNYTKTQPIQFEEFADCLSWWKDRVENDRAWRLPVKRIVENGVNLDIMNPCGKEDFEHLPPEKLVEDIVLKEQRILEIMAEIRQVLAGGRVD